MKCPHIIRKRAGDETYDLCELTERPSGRIQPCLIEHGLYECKTWEEIQAAWTKEKTLGDVLINVANISKIKETNGGRK